MPFANKFTVLTPEERFAQVRFGCSPNRDRGEQNAWSLPELNHDPKHRYDPFPLGDMQAYVIGCSENIELGPAGCQHYIQVELEDWDSERFRTAVRRLIDRHEMLRSIIHPEGHQRILECVPPFELKISDFRKLDPALVAAKLEETCSEMAGYVDTTDHWPLFEFRVSLLKSACTRLHIRLNLLIADNPSVKIICDELQYLYRDPGVSLPAIDLSFRDYTLATEAFEDSDAFRESRAYWTNRLATLPLPPELPLATSPASIVNPRFSCRRATMNASTWRVLKEKTSRKGLSISGILLAAYAEILAIWSKTPHFTLNLTLFDRLALRPQVNDIVGNFTLVNLLEVDNSEPQCFETRAHRQQAQFLEDLHYRHFSGIRVRRELTQLWGVRPKDILSVVFTSLLSIAVDCQEYTWPPMGKVVKVVTQIPQIYLHLAVQEDGGALVVDWFAVDEVFPNNLIDDLSEAFQRLIEQLAMDESAWTRTLAQNAEKLVPVYQSVCSMRSITPQHL